MISDRSGGSALLLAARAAVSFGNGAGKLSDGSALRVAGSPVSGLIDGTSVFQSDGDLLDLGLVVAEPLQVAERDQLEAVAGRADLRIDLEAALQLLACRTCRTARRWPACSGLGSLWNSSAASGAGGLLK